MGFEAAWLAAREPYDEAALDRGGVDAIRAWGAALPPEYVPTVVDLGSGTGVALRRVERWLAPRRLRGFAVDLDADLLAAASPYLSTSTVVPLVADVLEPLECPGGPPDGTVDLVVGHALADLLSLDRLAARVVGLLRPGGLAHIALAYDGLTELTPRIDGDLNAAVIAAFHRHLDRPLLANPSYGGSTAGRRLGPALMAVDLDVVTDAASIWWVRATDGCHGRQVLARLIRYVADAVREIGDVSAHDLDRWAGACHSALASGTLTARVGHQDVLARRPSR